MSKNAKKTVKLDPRKYKWTQRYQTEPTTSVFDGMVRRIEPPKAPLPVAVGDVYFDEALFDHVGFTYYGKGNVDEYAAVQLDNGNILFCLVHGSQFAGTFAPEHKVTMEFYDVEPL